ncbi:DUF421 domain-containing protein [Domibacillus iocasae]|uniref:YetF C-terminal domain-containing protein n=1 Tax=Domibacillus iocasae TaxID=1714016 RepID=A0A1E7DRA7_9BACI|nr:YetF domain-containing protein [Domibacillus iocasae]OES45626.1 hypothetical protein BA724_02105 [Domibacillus iocasae]
MPDFLNDIPSLPYPLKILLLLFAGIILLRTAGKKSLSSMTVAEAVMRIAVGTIIIGPLALKTEWEAIYGGTLFIIGIVLLMKMQIWFPKTREMLIGVPSVLIKDGKMRLDELRKARMTTDELEVALRQQKIGSIEDVELAILESNGQLSTTLKPGKAPATKEDIEKIVSLLVGNGILSSSENKSSSTPPLFKEVYEEAKDEDFKPEEQ